MGLTRLSSSGDHVRIGQQRTMKVARCASADLPALAALMPAGIDGALDKPQLI
jgi:hypothetical protein